MAGKCMLFSVFLIQYVFLYALVCYYLLIYSITNWSIVHDYNKWPDQIELPPGVERSQLVMLAAASVATAWLVASSCTFCCWIGSGGRKALFFFGVMDLICASLVLTAIILQSEYLPDTLAGCNNYQGNAGMRELFIHAGPKLATEAHPNKPLSPRAVCRSFMGEWIVGIVVVMFYLTTAILGIFNPKWEYIKVILTPIWWSLLGIAYIAKNIWIVLTFIWPPIRWILVTISWPFRASWFVLVRIAPSVRFAGRSRRKWKRAKSSSLPIYHIFPEKGQDSSDSNLIPLKDLSLQSLDNLVTVPTTTFERLLDDGNILYAFIRKSHLVDLSRLASTSKYLNRRIKTAGQQNGIFTLEILRWKSCQPGTKAPCWSCGTQICADCSMTVTPQLPETSCHLQYCEPRCSKCYLDSMCYRGSAARNCVHFSMRQRYMKIEKQDICSRCARLTKENIGMRRQEREKLELIHLARHNLRCGMCERRLPLSGPRWWGCSQCGVECTSDYHPAWSKPPE